MDLLECTLRRALNLAEGWFLTVVSEDDWNNKYKAILSADMDEIARLKDQEERWGKASEDGMGSFVLERRGVSETASNFNFKPASPNPQ